MHFLIIAVNYTIRYCIYLGTVRNYLMSIIATFIINYTQLINENGQLINTLPTCANTKEQLVELYRVMNLIRAFDKKAIALQRTGQIGTYAPIHGQEAIATAIGYVMHPNDVFIPYYRDYAAQIQRGVKMSEILAYWGGDERGNCFSHNNKDLPICVPIASQCLHAAGIAYAFKYRQQQHVAVASIGDGGTSEGDFYEALNALGALNLPAVFIINNNQWAISVPLNKQTHCQTLAQKAIAAGCNNIQVDGNDVLACCQVLTQAIENARNGDGPTLIEAISYRLSDHTTADDANRYQPSAEVENARTKEPIKRLKIFLEQEFQWNDTLEQNMQNTITLEIKNAVDEYLSIKPQEITSMFDYHYKNLPEYLIEQRAIAIEEAQNV